MELTGDYRLVELLVEPDDWVAGKNLREADLPEEGVLVLAVRRSDESFIGAPHGSTQVEAGDTLIVYGHIDAIEHLDERRKGFLAEQAHKEAAIKHRERRQGDRV